MKGHNGLDYASYTGEELYHSHIAPTSWTAYDASDNSGGLGLDIISDSPLAFDELCPGAGSQALALWEKQGKKIRIKHRYWHLKRPLVKNGEKVSHGTLIGECDNTGASTGSHLHWGMKYVDENGNTLDSDNGYYGAVDFTKLLDDRAYVMDFIAQQNELSLQGPDIEQKTAIYNLLLSFLTEMKVDISSIKSTLRRALGL